MCQGDYKNIVCPCKADECIANTERGGSAYVVDSNATMTHDPQIKRHVVDKKWLKAKGKVCKSWQARDGGTPSEKCEHWIGFLNPHAVVKDDLCDECALSPHCRIAFDAASGETQYAER